jgi:hypothetical protein
LIRMAVRSSGANARESTVMSSLASIERPEGPGGGDGERVLLIPRDADPFSGWFDALSSVCLD